MAAAILGHVTRFTVGWLYPDLMNIYGDRGNILTLVQRARWRGFDARVLELGKGSHEGIEEVDVLFFGGGQDREQALVYDDLLELKAEPLTKSLAQGAALLAVCGGYQLLGHYYQTAEGERFPGLGLLDLHTEAGSKRCIGNVVVDVAGLAPDLEPKTLVGFENHSGRTFLGEGLKPLGKVIAGSGNNGEDGTEGVAEGTIFGTYLHGSLLPKNPHLADHVMATALRQRRQVHRLDPLDDALELDAHRRVRDRELTARR